VTLAGLGIGYAQLVHGPLFADAVVPVAEAAAAPVETAGEITWHPFSPELLDASVRDGRTVFLDLTADWCWTCKVNERTVLADSEVEAAFLQNDVLTLKGDWTRKDPRITEILQRHQRAGVPFYAVYPADRLDEPIVLPELINKKLVLESLRKAGPSRAGV
jgi:thiol:disulfide interchange protein DsbD